MAPALTNARTNELFPPNAPTRGRSIDRVGFEVKDLETLYEQLRSQGIEFDVPYHERPGTGVWHAVFTDPSGVTVELSEGYDNL